MRYLLFVLLALSMTGCANVVHHNQNLVDHTIVPTSTAQQSEVAPETPAIPDVAQTTIPPPPSPVAMPFTEADVRCLAEAMYYEARGEGDKGMAAVGYVVTNRKALSKTFAPTICGVVYQGNRDKRGRLMLHQCQFSWACDGSKKTISDHKTYEHCQDLAKLVLLGYQPNPIGKRTHFDSVAHHSRNGHSRNLVNQLRVGKQVYFELLAKS